MLWNEHKKFWLKTASYFLSAYCNVSYNNFMLISKSYTLTIRVKPFGM